MKLRNVEHSRPAYWDGSFELSFTLGAPGSIQPKQLRRFASPTGFLRKKSASLTCPCHRVDYC
ncbi:hypothetical protein MKX50_20640 [Paenibacillus sp. FSL W8-0186]|uniref:hypothetical protein n=1 Tax=Paenibacillus sp. FSL W8-0186 TaxID=2921709 RepID=UPI0030CB5E59